MLDINKHKFYLTRILKDIYTDIELANCLGFKGGTALMFFYELPRFSIDLDFNLIKPDKEKIVYKKVHDILLKYGTIHDEAQKFYGLIIVLDYEKGACKLKVEISNRNFNDGYEIKNMLGINMNVMVEADMFAHKLCALLDRNALANRDIFDSWFFMNRHTPINMDTVETRMNMSFKKYIQLCIENIEDIREKDLLQGMGELMDDDIKNFVRTKLKAEVISLLKFYKEFPIDKDQ